MEVGLSQVEAGEVVFESLRGINERLVREAMEEWDKGGEGCFGEFVKEYVGVRWWSLVRSN